jgi:hypothetical protein
VRDATALTAHDPAQLVEAMGRWCASEDAARIWGEAAPPTEDDVADWITRAKQGGKPPEAKKSAAA